MLNSVATGIWKAASLWQVPAVICWHSENKLLIYIDAVVFLWLGFALIIERTVMRNVTWKFSHINRIPPNMVSVMQ